MRLLRQLGDATRLTWLLAYLLLPACQGSTPSLGLSAMLRVQGGQVVPHGIDEAPEGLTGAAVSGITTASNVVFPGAEGRVVSGKVGPNATAVAVGIPKDRLYWVLPGDRHDFTLPDLLNFSVSLDFSPDLADGDVFEVDDGGRRMIPLVFRAVTADGTLGSSLALPMRLLQDSPSDSLVVSLHWKAPVDLDLRVISPSPDGASPVEIWSKHGNNRAGGSGTSSAAAAGVGSLDFDSNAACDIDGRGRENVIWQGMPPAGHYIVRVDAFSLCGQLSADWEVAVTFAGQPLGGLHGNPASSLDAFGVANQAVTRGEHGAGAGVTAFEFDL